jgi:hypothetical protein
MSSRFGPGRIFVMIAGFKDVSFDDSEHTGARQLDDTALLQLSQRATHGFNRHSEVVGNIVTGDGECDAISIIRRHPRCHFLVYAKFSALLLRRFWLGGVKVF